MLDSVLDGSVHVGNKEKLNSASLTHLEPAANTRNSSGQLLVSPPTVPTNEEMSMLQKGVDDLKWKLNYEQGLHKEMVELL